MIIDFYNRGGGGPTPSDVYTKEEVNALIADFITATTDDLVNYYLKSETYTQAEIEALVGQITSFEVVATLPVSDIKTNVIYLLGPTGSGADRYEEWIYSNSTWVKIGETSVDLSNYITVNQLNTALGFYTTTQQLNTLLAAKQDTLTAGDGITIGTDNVISAESNVVSLTQAQYDALAEKDPDVVYIITDATPVTLATVATTGVYSDLTGTPTLATVATSGSYNDLTDKPVIPVVPTLATVATSGSYNDLTDKPSIPVVPELATVATSGSYNDLTDKPTIPVVPELATVATTGAYSDLTGTPTLANVATSGSYNDLTDKPSIPVVPELATVATTGDYDDLANKPSIPAVGAGTVTLTQNGSTIGTINVNDTNDKTIDIPGGGSGTQVQADWTEDDDSEPSYIQHKPALSTVATTGSYNDLTDKLTPGSHITISSQNVISGESNVVSLTQAEYDQIIPEEDVIYVITDATPVTLATVATTGNYNDLTNKPVIPVVPTLATVATSGSYNDLTDKPSIPVVPELATVATTGDYDDLTNKPSIPTVGAGTVTLTQNGSTIGTINVNDNDDKTIDIPGGGGGLGDDTIPLTISFNDGTTATYNVVIATNNGN